MSPIGEFATSGVKQSRPDSCCLKLAADFHIKKLQASGILESSKVSCNLLMSLLQSFYNSI
jgi:hypothetical protein